MSNWAKEERDNIKVTQHTTLFDFCNFIEKELKVTFTTQQWEIYRDTKKVSLQNEKKYLINAFKAGDEDSFPPDTKFYNGEGYYTQTFKND